MSAVGFQLYSARSYKLDDVLPMIARLGYSYGEGYGSLYTDPPALKSQLAANGLTMPTAHISLDELENADKTLKLADTLGIQFIICPWLHPDQRPKDEGGWSRFGERLEKLSRPYLRAGKKFGYHNHDFEFVRFGDRYAMDLLLEAAPGLSVEADVAWIVRGGADPGPWLEKNGTRVEAIHVKDVAPEGQNKDEDGWADPGQGIVPWMELIKTIKASTRAKYFIAEHDNPNDINRFARRAMEAIRSFGV